MSFRIRSIFIKLIDRKLCIAKVCIGFRIAGYKGFPDKKANIRLLEQIPLKMDWEIGRNFTLNLSCGFRGIVNADSNSS